MYILSTQGRGLLRVIPLMVFLLVSWASMVRAEDFICGTSAFSDSTGGQSPPALGDYSDLVAAGLIFHRYIPSSGNGATDIQFTYSESIRDGFEGATVEERTHALEGALDSLAMRLCDDIHNTVGSSECVNDFETTPPRVY